MITICEIPLLLSSCSAVQKSQGRGRNSANTCERAMVCCHYGKYFFKKCPNSCVNVMNNFFSTMLKSAHHSCSFICTDHWKCSEKY